MSKKTQFIGDKEVKSIDGTLVTFIDDTQKTYTELQLSYMVTDESKDLSEMQEIIVINVAKDVGKAIQSADLDNDADAAIAVLNVLQSHDVRLGDSSKILGTVMAKIDIIFKTVISSIDEPYYEAVGKAFWTYVEGRPSKDFRDNIRMSDIIRLNK